ncbi:MAG: hypothetical protein V1899_03790 [Planctomycetota bacterium]
MRTSKRLKQESGKINSSRRSTRCESVRTSGSGISGTTIMIGGGVVVLALLGLLIAGSRSNNKKKIAKPAVQQEEFSDRTPAATWARRGQEKEAQGDRAGAIDDYRHAGEAAEREGSPRLAKNYTMHAYQLQKFTTLKISGGH